MKMSGHWYIKPLFLVFILAFNSTKAQGKDPPKPKFPDVFQVEVQGLLRYEKLEVDGSLYYDRITNQAALHYKHQNEFSITIYNFNDNQMMFIKDFQCSVTDIPESGSFFPYSKNGENKTLNPAEEFFFFTKSVFDREEESLIPSYVYKGSINATQYNLYNCKIFHIFSKPELELPDCDSHTCKPTLISISLQCPSPVAGEEEVHHSYNFFRFRTKIVDENVFQPPVGVHCKTLSHKTFPDFPPYYSFSYSLIKEQKETEIVDRSLYTTYKKVWHDTKLRVIRVDGFDSQGLLQDTRIFDFYGQIAYTIIARIPICQPGLLNEDIALYDLTLLPRIFFKKVPGDKENVVYIGKREVHGLDFDVWTQSFDIRDAQSTVVMEFYFSNNAPDDEESESNYFQISHVNTYAYQKDDISEKLELIGQTYISISNFRSKKKEWEAFDVSSCYEANEKESFQLKVEGPPMVKNSYDYEEVLEQLYMKLMNETQVSLIRINQLKGTFDGIYLKGFSGWILEKMEIEGTGVNKKEPAMREAIKLIAKAASSGKFDIVIRKENQENSTFRITSMININPDVDPPKPTFPDVFQVDVQGIFHSEKQEMDGTIIYDRPNNRAVLSYTYQNKTTNSIFDFTKNQLLYIKDIDCSVSDIKDDETTFFPFSIDKNTKKKVIASPEECFFFKSSKFHRQEEIPFPMNIFTASLDIPVFGLSNCEVNHFFTTPEVELPDCDYNRTCKPILVSISVICPARSVKEQTVFHTYNFYRFRTGIKDVSVFQPPVGVHCNIPSDKDFPDFPEFYSFSYDLVEEQMSSGAIAAVRDRHLKIWHDTKLDLVRLDEFDDKGFVEGTRIFDFKSKVSYTIVAVSPTCIPVFLKQVTPLETITSLPKIFFAKKKEEKKSASYIGKRTVNGVVYDVWTQTHDDSLTDAKIVQEFYFTENIPDGLNSEKSFLRISHVDSYTYQTDSQTGKDVLVGTSYLSISNFQSKKKEWEAFDVSSCYEANEKKSIQLKVEGPPMVKDSYEYQDGLEQLYGKLMEETEVSVVRINQLKGQFDGIYLTEFSGWILEKTKINGTEVNGKELNMREAIKKIAKAASFGQFNIVINSGDKENTYQITSLMDISLETDPPKPTFPDTFQVDVQGIFHKEMREMDASIFYDRPNNRIMMTYTYQNEITTKIFDFKSNQLLNIEGVDCTVSNITDDATAFFPINTDKVTKKKIMASPEEFFFFKNSKYYRQDLSNFPTYVFTANLDISFYGLTKCEVNHLFSKPEVELPDCDDHSCKPTLVSISVKCPARSAQDKGVFHTYNFYRFRSGIEDLSVFQPPVGVHCNIPSDKDFPDFPEYYSFSYDIIKEQMNSKTRAAVRAKHYKIWHDTKLSLVRMDEFDEDGFIENTKIFDFYGRVAYTIVASSPKCTPVFLKRNTPLESLTPLPKIFFAKKPEDKKLIGKRTINGIDYEVWTKTHENASSYVREVQEFYFTKNIPEGQKEDKAYLRISHVDKYTYKTNRQTGKETLSSSEYLSISDYRSEPKEWEAFDIASCFKGEQKKGFRLKVEGPPLIKNSYMYESVLQKLHLRLIMLTNASLVRISELQGIFDGTYVTEFNGWILDKLQLKEATKVNKEPDMHKTYELIEESAAAGKLTIEITKDQIYNVTGFTNVVPSKTGSCTSGGTIAGIAIVTLLIGAVLGIAGYYAFMKNRDGQPDRDRIVMNTIN